MDRVTADVLLAAAAMKQSNAWYEVRHRLVVVFLWQLFSCRAAFNSVVLGFDWILW